MLLAGALLVCGSLHAAFGLVKIEDPLRLMQRSLRLLGVNPHRSAKDIYLGLRCNKRLPAAAIICNWNHHSVR